MRAHFVFEKFSKESDPVKDMGIGLPDWNNLKPGTILRAKNDIGIDSYMRFNNASGYDHISKGNRIQIKKLNYNWHGAELYIHDGWHSITGTLKQFKNRFDIDGYQKLKESLNEKFKEVSDPVKDMGIGYKKRVLESMTWKLLEFIQSKGKEGASLTEIQFFIWTKLEGHDPDEFWQVRRNYLGDRSGRKTRGHWNTQLFGGTHYHGGLLHRFCKKNPETKKWVLVRFPRPDERLYDWPK